jgi:Glycosyltransferase like family
MSAPHASLSVVCVYNNPAVRRQCLDRSIEVLSREATDVEYIPIDNVNGTYPSAGTALNHGVSLARNDVVAFVHQDVYLHSLTALTVAAGQVITEGFGLLGAVGVHSDGRIVGRIRDRVVLLGDAVASPTDVDSVDEVLFLAPRSLLLRDPLTESCNMAWHAYAVEYGLRVRRRGLRSGVANMPLTHNSLTTNLDRLDEAHQAIAASYSDMLPVRTTCGMITARTEDGGGNRLPSQRWRYPWLRESLIMRNIGKTVVPRAAVLADIRRDVDDLIDRSPGRQLHILNNLQGRRFMDAGANPLELTRRNGNVAIAACDMPDIVAALRNASSSSWLLLTNLSRMDLLLLGPQLPAASGVLGFHTGIGFWFLLGASIEDLPSQWLSRRATPLGTRPLAAGGTA